jgi:large subunit ribosomal protein L30
MANKTAKKIQITLIRSTIGRKPEHRRTVRALGLRKINQTVEKEVNPGILGMVRSVSFLLDVKEID